MQLTLGAQGGTLILTIIHVTIYDNMLIPSLQLDCESKAS